MNWAFYLYTCGRAFRLPACLTGHGPPAAAKSFPQDRLFGARPTSSSRVQATNRLVQKRANLPGKSPMSSLNLSCLFQTSAGAQVKGQCDKIPFRLRADSAKKLYFSASSTYIIVSCWSSLVTLQQRRCTASQRHASEVAGGLPIASFSVTSATCD